MFTPARQTAATASSCRPTASVSSVPSPIGIEKSGWWVTELTEAVGRHEDAVTAVCRAGVNIALAGHFHRTYAEAARKMVETAGGALVIQAGTATSTRLRNDELQSFNWIHAHRRNDIELQVIAWDGHGFRRGNHVRFGFDGESWSSRTVTHDSPAEQAVGQMAGRPRAAETRAKAKA